jgi:hypothetical protein
MIFMLFGTTNAFACSLDPSVPESTPEDLYSRAASVFVAHLTKTEEINETGEPKDALVEGTFRPIEVLKGQLPADGKVRSAVYGPGHCTIPLLSGMDYIFHIDDKKNYATLVNGSVPLWSINTPGAQRLLETLRSFRK